MSNRVGHRSQVWIQIPSQGKCMITYLEKSYLQRGVSFDKPYLVSSDRLCLISDLLVKTRLKKV